MYYIIDINNVRNKFIQSNFFFANHLRILQLIFLSSFKLEKYNSKTVANTKKKLFFLRHLL